MRNSRTHISRVTSEAGELLDELTMQPPGVPPPRRRTLDAYHGHGTPDKLYVRARVRSRGRVGAVTRADSRWRNLLNTVRRVTSRGASGIPVIASFRGVEVEALSDARGFVAFEIPVPPHLVEAREWWEVELRAEPGGDAESLRVTAQVLVPDEQAEYGVISDIDDTVVRTEATNWIRMLRIVFLTNAYTRTPFEHVATLYRALRAGGDGESRNPIFYVSSSPWSFYDLLEHFFRIHGLPVGPLFLKSYRASLRKLRASSHHGHKLAWIRLLLDTYPTLPFVLIGDSGQEDPEIYREVVRTHPGRILAIFIRDVTSPRRDAAVGQVAEEVRAMGVPMMLVEDKLSAGEAAAHLGLIQEVWIEVMRREAEGERKG